MLPSVLRTAASQLHVLSHACCCLMQLPAPEQTRSATVDAKEASQGAGRHLHEVLEVLVVVEDPLRLARDRQDGSDGQHLRSATQGCLQRPSKTSSWNGIRLVQAGRSSQLGCGGSLVLTGWRPRSVSAPSRKASAPSITAFATSVASAL